MKKRLENASKDLKSEMSHVRNINLAINFRQYVNAFTLVSVIFASAS